MTITEIRAEIERLKKEKRELESYLQLKLQEATLQIGEDVVSLFPSKEVIHLTDEDLKILHNWFGDLLGRGNGIWVSTEHLKKLLHYAASMSSKNPSNFFEDFSWNPVTTTLLDSYWRFVTGGPQSD